ncbi:MAG: NADH dehydrogenase ubiquinone Fe-S protein 4 [Hellea sp.]
MLAKIYQPSPSAMTSGRAKRHWVLEFTGKSAGVIDPLTGTTRSTDVRSQLDLKFDTLDEAVAYAKANGIPHQVVQSQKMKRIPRSYAENFAFDRKLPWTH